MSLFSFDFSLSFPYFRLSFPDFCFLPFLTRLCAPCLLYLPHFFHLSFRFSPFPIFVFALFFINALPPFSLCPFLLFLCISSPFFHVFSPLCILFPFSSFRIPIRGASSRRREYSFPYSKEHKDGLFFNKPLPLTEKTDRLPRFFRSRPSFSTLFIDGKIDIFRLFIGRFHVVLHNKLQIRSPVYEGLKIVRQKGF